MKSVAVDRDDISTPTIQGNIYAESHVKLSVLVPSKSQENHRRTMWTGSKNCRACVNLDSIAPHSTRDEAASSGSLDHNIGV